MNTGEMPRQAAELPAGGRSLSSEITSFLDVRVLLSVAFGTVLSSCRKLTFELYTFSGIFESVQLQKETDRFFIKTEQIVVVTGQDGLPVIFPLYPVKNKSIPSYFRSDYSIAPR